MEHKESQKEKASPAKQFVKFSPSKRKKSSPLPKEKVKEEIKERGFRFEDVDLADSLDISAIPVHKENTFLDEEFPSDDSLDLEQDDQTSQETILPSTQHLQVEEVINSV